MADIDQVENAWLGGSTAFDEFIGKFEAEFMAPVEKRMQRILWATLGDQEKALLEALAPEAFEEVKRQMEG